MIVGALVQFDWAKEDCSVLASKVDGNGWMMGPYLSARVHENIYFDLRAAWGRSSNDLDARRHHRRLRYLALAGQGHARRQLVSMTPGASRPRPSSPT